MSSKVYFIATHESDSTQSIESKLAKLVYESKILDFISKNDNVAIKIHFGEEGNVGYVKPQYVRVIVDAILHQGATSFVSDTNTLYRGRRMNSKDHFELAYEHGFTPEIVGTLIHIPDDTKSENIASIPVNQKFIKVAKIAKIFTEADVLVGVSHFKGHMMTGFGATLKNLGMGCATRDGKLAQHCDLSPQVRTENCVGCGACVAVCPVNAITLTDKKAFVNSSLCIGCASCIAACKYEAMDVVWEEGASTIQEKMIEYAKAALEGKEERKAFFNFAIKITKECDCLAKDDPRIASDVGIFASSDPVSIDKASMDLINKTCGQDIFKKVHPERDGYKQLEYAAKIGLGSLDYELITL